MAQPSNTPAPPPPPQPVDLTTPAAIIAGVALVIAMIGAATWGPPDLAAKIMPLLTPLLGAMAVGMTFFINQRVAAAKTAAEDARAIALETHAVVNSRMDAARQEIIAAADQRVQAAREAALLEGHAAGLALGQAQAAAAINATLAVASVPAATTPPAPTTTPEPALPAVDPLAATAALLKP